ncbi:unnamed protein product [Owenia fusiformis]|uniref:Peptidase C1A papain C-terminal domain-containing protein n=1 Tax=Owenia fusiformis TaxID=6347 RepID=A0A8S4N983_OWEFU|nr:unnamed protein product [Owenia fusiformis]
MNPWIEFTKDESTIISLNDDENIKRHSAYNSKRTHNASAIYGINKFSDLSQEEFRKLYLLDSRLLYSAVTCDCPPAAPSINPPTTSYPLKFDWRDKKVVTPVKNQKACGACWAFSVVETVESMVGIKYNSTPGLSVQQVIDCAGGPNQGCNGGDTCNAIDWMKTSRTALVKEELYPLTDSSDACKMFPSGQKGARVKDFQCYGFTNSLTYPEREEELWKWLYHYGPLSISVDATTWNDYLGGIIQYHCEAWNNHAVQIIGYDRSGPIPYYIARNSWGTDWGIDGYLHIKIGKNVCGVANRVSRIITY